MTHVSHFSCNKSKPNGLKICFFIDSILSGFGLALALGDEHSLVLKQDGSVWSTAIAFTTLNKIPDNDRTNHFMKMIPSHAIAVAAGNHFSTMLK